MNREKVQALFLGFFFFNAVKQCPPEQLSLRGRAGSRPQIRWAEPSTMARCSPGALEHRDPTVACLPARPCPSPRFARTSASTRARLSELKTPSVLEIWP